MNIYAISDLHLSFGNNKPMDIFGVNWKNHTEKVKKDWLEKVTEEDVVLMPGDFSWSMNLKDSIEDFKYINDLPGKKILLKGNHDYWWTTLSKMQNFLLENNFKNIEFLYNNNFTYGQYSICGTRGWGKIDTDEDLKIYKREILRLKLSMENIEEDKKIIVCTHFPPFLDKEFTNILKEKKVEKCIYGHLHAVRKENIIEGYIDNIEYKMVSCDYLDFKLIQI